MKLCQKCGTRNLDDSIFCISCGNSFPQASDNKGMPMNPQGHLNQSATIPMQLNQQMQLNQPMPGSQPMPGPMTPNQQPMQVNVPIQASPVKEVNESNEPVVGWLVCINGADRGEDYRIRAKNNRIGSDVNSDICLAKNESVKGSDFATIAYYTKKNVYYFIPGDDSGSIMINEEIVEIPLVLNNGDIIKMGGSEYKFIPLCNEDFQWE